MESKIPKRKAKKSDSLIINKGQNVEAADLEFRPDQAS